MTSHEDKVRAINTYVGAFEAGDPDAVAALFADDATVEDPVGAEILRGVEAIRAFYTESMKTGAKLELLGPVRTVADYAVFPFAVKLNYTGKEQRIDVIDTFRFNTEGKIVEMRAFWGPDNTHGF